MNSVKGFPTKPSKGKYRDKKRDKFQEEALHLEKRKIKLMEERLIKKAQADEEDDYMFLVSLFVHKKKSDDIQRLELRKEFLSSLTRRIQIDKKFFAAL